MCKTLTHFNHRDLQNRLASPLAVRDVLGRVKLLWLPMPPPARGVEDYTPLRSRTPGSEGRGGIRVHAQRIFTVSDDDVEDMLKTKVKGASKVGVVKYQSLRR